MGIKEIAHPLSSPKTFDGNYLLRPGILVLKNSVRCLSAAFAADVNLQHAKAVHDCSLSMQHQKPEYCCL